MQKYTKIYYTHFGYSTGDFVPCELTGGRAVDVHHIESRGMGGTEEKDVIENLQAITRELHEIFGDKQQHKEFLKEAHRCFMLTRVPYIRVNPDHESFDILVDNPKYKFELMKRRAQIN